MYNLKETVKNFINRYLKRLRIILLYCFQYIVILNYGNYAKIVNKTAKYTRRKKKSILFQYIFKNGGGGGGGWGGG